MENGNNGRGARDVREFRVALYETIYCYICVFREMARGLLMRNVKTPFTRHGNSDFHHFKAPRVLTAPCFYLLASAMRLCQSAMQYAPCRLVISRTNVCAVIVDEMCYLIFIPQRERCSKFLFHTLIKSRDFKWKSLLTKFK